MNKKLKGMLAAALALLLITGTFAGCGGKENSSAEPSEQPSSSSSEVSVDSSSVTEDGGEAADLIRGNIYKSGDKILKEKKTYRVAVNKDPNSQNGFADKQCVQETNAATNVDIEWLDIPSDSWKEQVNIMIAGDNLPDAFCGAEVDIMSNLELFVPIGDYVDEIAPAVKEMLDTDTVLKTALTAPDGKIYVFPTNKDNPSNRVDNMLWMNPEWLEKANMKAPTTTDEFVEVLRYFRDNDMNGNGDPNDEIPFQARQANDYAHNLSAILGAFGVVLPSDYVYSLDGETVTFGGTEPGLFDALNWLHMLYDEKLLDNDTFTMTNDEQNAKAQNEDVLMGSLIYWIPDSMDTKYADYIVLDPLKGPKGDQLWYGGKQPTATFGYCVTTACEDPEVLIRYYDYCMKDETTIMEWQWGPEGAGLWKYTDDEGHWTQTQEFVPEGTNLTYFKRTICGSVNSPNYIWKKYADLEVADPRNAKKREAAERILPYCVTMMPKGLYDPEKTAARNLLLTDIDNYMSKFVATSVVNGLTEAQWNEHLENCKRLRTEEYVAMWQEYFDSKK
ncbi:extracellular solute-binding protein [Acutalibacter muris]|uniref:Extracellular solute-binding protein n=1 Tax=Acutalibacter muris TaxID=1796620 RepID=A0A1Z2XQC7_9FIRM|nr:extracellular solute-binding protein [Acutalibacter muris]ANU52693.1 hypothetical protein A4V00_00905 [Hungateiclostridiaceae bacterium KB18]ASB40640.1 hypothetical protein ADH66_08190 [Acutalibacter muris]QQR29917.1 extracellular solute-binding protein [Acutalibacter muris]